MIKLFDNFKFDEDYIRRELQKHQGYDDDRLQMEVDNIKYVIDSLYEKDKVKIYRVLFLPDKTFINKDNLGDHWTLDRNTITNYRNSLLDGGIESFFQDYNGDEEFDKDDFKTFLITAEVDVDNINIKGTIEMYIQFPLEAEVELKNMNKINVLSIKEYDETEEINELKQASPDEYYDVLSAIERPELVQIIKHFDSSFPPDSKHIFKTDDDSLFIHYADVTDNIYSGPGLYILGFSSKTKTMNRKSIQDTYELLDMFKERIHPGLNIFTSVNKNSEPLLKRLRVIIKEKGLSSDLTILNQGNFGTDHYTTYRLSVNETVTESKFIKLFESYNIQKELENLTKEILYKIGSETQRLFSGKDKITWFPYIKLEEIQTYNDFEILKEFIVDKGNMDICILTNDDIQGDVSFSEGENAKYLPFPDKPIILINRKKKTLERINEELKTGHIYKGNTVRAIRYYLHRDYKSTLTHELQHAYDNWRSGGKALNQQTSAYAKDVLQYNSLKLVNFKELKDKEIDFISKHYKKYINLKHEVDAQFTQAVSDTSFYDLDIDLSIEKNMDSYLIKPFKEVKRQFQIHFANFRFLTEKERWRVLRKLGQFYVLEKDFVKELNSKQKEYKK